MKKFVFISLALVLMSTMVFAALKDVPANHWAAPAINSLVTKGIITGYPDGTYRGKAFVTRYQIAVILNRAVDYLESPLNSVQEKLKNLTNTVLTLNDYDSFLNTQQMQMQDKMESMVSTITSIQNTIAGMEGFNNDISFLYKKLGIVSDQVKSLSNQLNGFATKGDLANLTDTVNAVFKTVSVDNQQTNDSITGLSNIVYSNRDKLMDISAKTADLQAKVSKMNYSNDLDLIYSKLAALKELQLDQVSSIKKLQDEIDSLNDLSASVQDNQAAINDVALSLGSTVYNLQDTVSANTNSIKQLQTSLNQQITKVSSDVTAVKTSVDENTKTAKSASSMAMMALVAGIVGIALGAYAAFK